MKLLTQTVTKALKLLDEDIYRTLDNEDISSLSDKYGAFETAGEDNPILHA